MLRRIAAYFIAITMLLTPLTSFNASASPVGQQRQAHARVARKLAPELETATSGTVRVIVQTKGRPSAAHDQAIAGRGGSKRKAFD